MPQVARFGKFVIMIYTADHAPAHVHVRFDNCSVRVLITETTATRDTIEGNPKAQEIAQAVKAVAANLEACNAKWKELYG